MLEWYTDCFNLKLVEKQQVQERQIDGETMERVTDCTFWGSRITADGNCSHKISRYLLLGRKTITSIDSK